MDVYQNPPRRVGSGSARGYEAGSIEGVAGEIDSFGLVAFVEDHVSSHTSFKVFPKVSVLLQP